MLLPMILQTANAPGTGAFALLSPPTGRLPFVGATSFASGAQVMYRADDNAGLWEEGYGTAATGSPNDTLTRTVVTKNSAGTTSPINFPGAVDIYCDLITDRAVWLNNSRELVNGSTTARLNGSTLVTLGSAPSIANVTETAVSWTTVSDDLGAWAGGNPTRLTVPAGMTRARLSWQLSWTANATGFRRCRVRKNGTTLDIAGAPQSTMPSVGAGDIPMVTGCSAILPVSAGDYFEAMAYQNSGGALSLYSTLTASWFSMERIA